MIVRTALANTLKALIAFPFNAFSQAKPQLKYLERPWKREAWLALNSKGSLKDAMHGAWLMASGVLPFSYDGYQYACSKAVEAQPELTKQDLLMMMRLGVDYGVRLSPLSELLENQIFLRIHRDYELQMLDYEKQVTQQLQQMLAQLQTRSQDYFQLLKEEIDQDQIDLEEEVEISKQKIVIPLVKERDRQTEDDSELMLQKLNEKLKNRKERQFEVKDLLSVAELIRQWNSPNLQMIQYLLELLTIKLQSKQVQAPTALTYHRFLTFACQSLFAEYQKNRDKYTPRSIKRIYKYQYFYFQEHFRQLITSDSSSTPEFVEQLLESYAGFPLKTRELRRKVGIYMGSQLRRFSLTDRQDLVSKLLDINGKDQKMKKSYRSLLGLPTTEPLLEEVEESPAELVKEESK